MKRYKLISCSIFIREISGLLGDNPNSIFPVFLDLGAHNEPEKLKKLIQKEIDKTESENFDAILLAYGLCGNSLLGVRSNNLPLVLPKAHDCCTILLGSRNAFKAHFSDNLSASWSCNGYMESKESHFHASEKGKIFGLDKSYEELIELYGKENADYLIKEVAGVANEGPLFYIDLPETSIKENITNFLLAAEKKKQEYILLEGNISLLKGLLDGDWNENFLIVPPGSYIEPSYNEDVVGISK
jgi:hypothetical protein